METCIQCDAAWAAGSTNWNAGIPLQACAAWVERWPLILGLIQDPFAASIRQHPIMDVATTITVITFGGTAAVMNALMAWAYWVAR